MKENIAQVTRRQLLQAVAAYIDRHYVEAREKKVFASRNALGRRREETACEMAMPCQSAPVPRAASLEEMLRQADAGFTETLLRLIDRTGKKDSEVYKKANLSKQHFSKIRNNPDYKPTKATALSLALALELDLAATKDLIGRAGYALSNSSKFDLIIRYFIEQGNYNVVEINCVLFEHDQSLLGS
jgi:DNA-binding phage protein